MLPAIFLIILGGIFLLISLGSFFTSTEIPIFLKIVSLGAAVFLVGYGIYMIWDMKKLKKWKEKYIKK